jgi:hypothetical protein
MRIPTLFSQINWVFTGTAAPLGAEVTCGVFSDANTDADNIADLAGGVWAATILTAQVTTITLASVKAKVGPNDVGPSAEVAVGTAGSQIGSGAAPGTAYLVKKNTALGGRRNRGRMYIPGVDEDKVNPSGGITPSWITTVQTTLDDFFDGMAAVDLPLVVLHTQVPGITQPSPVTITGLTLDQTVATQRRRLRR